MGTGGTVAKQARQEETEAMTEPKIVPIKGGWLAVGRGWAVVGTSPEEARAAYEMAEHRHEQIDGRMAPVHLGKLEQRPA